MVFCLCRKAHEPVQHIFCSKWSSFSEGTLQKVSGNLVTNMPLGGTETNGILKWLFNFRQWQLPHTIIDISKPCWLKTEIHCNNAKNTRVMNNTWLLEVIRFYFRYPCLLLDSHQKRSDIRCADYSPSTNLLY